MILVRAPRTDAAWKSDPKPRRARDYNDGEAPERGVALGLEFVHGALRAR